MPRCWLRLPCKALQSNALGRLAGRPILIGGIDMRYGFKHALDQVVVWSAYTGAAVLLLCAAVTVVDIVLRNFFASGVPGIVDLTQLAVIWGAFLTIPMGFAQGSHISVDLLTASFGPLSQRVVTASGLILGAIVMAGCAWWGWQQTAQQVGYGDRSMTIGIPILWFWLPLLFGCTLSILCVVAAVLGLFFPVKPSAKVV